MEEKLKYIYDDIYRWLVFAEAKNIALITICLVIVENIISNAFNVESQWFPVSVCTVIFLSLCCILMICSMIPFLNNSRFVKRCAKNRYHKYKSSSNTIFYGSIFYKHMDNIYRNIIIQSYSNNTNLNKFEEDLIQQIEETSAVVLIKIYFFDATIKILLLGICSLLVTIIICA